jgi:hypothetical protein
MFGNFITFNYHTHISCYIIDILTHTADIALSLSHCYVIHKNVIKLFFLWLSQILTHILTCSCMRRNKKSAAAVKLRWNSRRKKPNPKKEKMRKKRKV